MFMTTLLFASCNLSLRPSVDHQLSRLWSLTGGHCGLQSQCWFSPTKEKVGQCSVNVHCTCTKSIVPLRFGCFHSLLYTRCTLTRQVNLLPSTITSLTTQQMWRRGGCSFIGHVAWCSSLLPIWFPAIFQISTRGIFFLASKNRLCNKQRSQ